MFSLFCVEHISSLKNAINVNFKFCGVKILKNKKTTPGFSEYGSIHYKIQGWFSFNSLLYVAGIDSSSLHVIEEDFFFQVPYLNQKYLFQKLIGLLFFMAA